MHPDSLVTEHEVREAEREQARVEHALSHVDAVQRACEDIRIQIHEGGPYPEEKLLGFWSLTDSAVDTMREAEAMLLMPSSKGERAT